jgi:uncharacterized membrane protein required for colicin V production
MPIDILFLISLAYGFWQGFNQGVISTVFNLGAYVFGITLAFKLTPATTNLMEVIFHSNNPMLYVGAFLVNIVTVMFIVRVLARSLEKALQAAYIGIVNQALGALLLAGFYIVVCSVVVWFMVKAQFFNKETIADSKTYPLLEPLPGKAYDMALRFKPLAEDAWGTSMNWMDRLQKYGDEKTQPGAADAPRIYKPDENTAIESDPNAGDKPPAKTYYPPEDGDGIEE